MSKQSLTSQRNHLNVFKRRTGKNISSKNLLQWKQQSEIKKFKRVKNDSIETHIQFFANLQEQITKPEATQQYHSQNSFKIRKQFEKIINFIEPRRGCFYKYGFKSFEKENKKLFAEVLNISSSKMRGTMHIGQLWPKPQTTKFMKANRIYVNNVKLTDKLKRAKIQQQRDMDSYTTINIDSKNSINFKYGTSRNISRNSTRQISQNSLKQLNLTMQNINKKIKQLKPEQKDKNEEKFVKMEKCIQKFDQIRQNYRENIDKII